MQNTFFWHTCVFCFVFLPESLQLQYDHRDQLSPPANSTFHCNFVIFPPSIFRWPYIFPGQYLSYSSISTCSKVSLFTVHPTDVNLSRKEAPSSSIPISPGPLPAYLRVNFLLFQVIWVQNMFQIIFHLTLQFSGLVCGLGLIGIRGSRSKVDFQSSSYGFSQTIPRSGAMNEDCLQIVIWREKSKMFEFWGGAEYLINCYLMDDFNCVRTHLVSFVSSKPSSLKTTENFPPS